MKFRPLQPSWNNLLAGIVLLVMPILTGCGEPSTPRSVPTAGSQTPEAASIAPQDTASSGPRTLGIVPWFSLTDQRGKSFGTEDLRGKVWVGTFFFTRCGLTCPQQVAQLKKLQDQLRQDKLLDDVHLVALTVDPANDTTDVLKTYAKTVGGDPAHWSFLTGDRRDIWGLARYDFRLSVSEAQNNPNQVIAHSPQFILVDRVGRIRGYYNALEEKDRQALNRDLKIVVDDPEGNPHAANAARQLAIPPEILNPAWLDERSRLQRDTVDAFEVFHNFQFRDNLLASGIRFQHKSVEDAGRVYKAVHYDHGNGLAVADVDGDGNYDIYFTSQLGGNELWRNKGDGTFENITKQAGVGVPDRISVSASFADIDNDGDSDLFVTTVRGGNLLFENVGGGKFKDISQAAGVDYVGHSSGAVFFDFDRDGLVDLLVVNVGKYTTEEKGPGGYYIGFKDAFAGHLKPERAERKILYRNLGNRRFTDVTEKMGLVDLSWSGDASPIDLNDDGWPDIYLLNMQGHDEYYENVEGKKFVKKSRQVFPRTPWGSMGIKVFDFDNDGRMDIFVTDMHTDMQVDVPVTGPATEKYPWQTEKEKRRATLPASYLNTDLNHVMGNAFYHNLGGGKFEEISDAIGAETFWPWGLSTGDLNADGYEDAFITASMNFEFRYAVNSLLLNNRGKKFLDSEFILGVEPRRGRRTAKPWFDLDCSGADQKNSYCKDRKGRFVAWGAVGSRSSVILDLDNDGDLDIVTNDLNSEPMVLVSNLSDKKTIHYLKVALVGTRSNRDGLGALVKVRVGSQTLSKVQDGKSGYLSQSSLPLYFGLDKAETIDGIEVVWPSGQRQAIPAPIKAGQTLRITEPRESTAAEGTRR